MQYAWTLNFKKNVLGSPNSTLHRMSIYGQNANLLSQIFLRTRIPLLFLAIVLYNEKKNFYAKKMQKSAKKSTYSAAARIRTSKTVKYCLERQAL